MSSPAAKSSPWSRNGIHDTTPRKSNLKTDDTDAVSEWKLGLYGLIFSLLVISCKVFYANRDYIRDKLFVDKLVTYETLTQDGDRMFRHGWKTALRYSRFWLPVVCGALTTTFTWVMVYLDSDVPGVQPPTPLSPAKYKRLSGHTFHLNYVFALVIGFLVGGYMFWQGVSIEF